MNVNDITIGQARALVSMLGVEFGRDTPPAAPSAGSAGETRITGHGRRVIVRSRDAGVQVGDLESYTPTEVVLRNARQMWRWKAASGGTLLDCATHGVVARECKFSASAERVVVLGACAIIDVTPSADKTMEGVAW